MKLSGEVVFQWTGDNMQEGKGKVWTLLKRGQIQDRQNPQVPLPLTLFDALRAEIQIQDGVLRVTKFEVSGKDQKGALQGDIQIPLKGEKKIFDFWAMLQFLLLEIPPK